MLHNSSNSYLYDAEGRLCAVNNGPGDMYQYVYDAAGNRVAKGQLSAWPAKPGSGPYVCPAPTGSTFTLTNLHLLGQGGEQVTELTVNAGTVAWAHSNAWEGGRLTGTYDSAGLHFDIADPLGTKRVQVNSSGVPELNCLMFPWGNDFNNTFVPDCVTPSGGSAANDATEHHFTKKERDNESGNDYFGARYYASSVGRFMSPDWSAKVEPVPYAKLDNPQSLNLYVYVGNNPLVGVDVDGHDYFSDMRDKDQQEAEEEAQKEDPQPPAEDPPPAPAQQQDTEGTGDQKKKLGDAVKEGYKVAKEMTGEMKEGLLWHTIMQQEFDNAFSTTNGLTPEEQRYDLSIAYYAQAQATYHGLRAGLTLQQIQEGMFTQPVSFLVKTMNRLVSGPLQAAALENIEQMRQQMIVAHAEMVQSMQSAYGTPKQ